MIGWRYRCATAKRRFGSLTPLLRWLRRNPDVFRFNAPCVDDRRKSSRNRTRKMVLNWRMKKQSVGTLPFLGPAVVVGVAALVMVLPEVNRAQEVFAPELPRPPLSFANGPIIVGVTNIHLTGISDLGGSKKAFFQVVLGPAPTTPDLSVDPVIAEGGEDSGIKVVQIDVQARTVKVRINEGAPIDVRLGTAGKLPQLSEPSGSRVYLTGLSDIGGKKVAQFQVVPSPQRPELKRFLYPVLKEGQKEAGVEVLQIDAKAGSVRVRINGSAPEQLTFESPRKQPGAISPPSADHE
jgi:hypothetical protein